MRLLLALCFALLAGLVPAAAAERALLAPPGLKATLNATPGAAAGLRALHSKAAAQGGKLRVIVGLRVPFAAEGALPGATQAAQRRDISAAATQIRSRFAAAIARDPQGFRSYSALPFVSLEVTADELDRLAGDPQVITLSEDRLNRPTLAQSGPLVGAPAAWSAGFTGKGQTVAIIDTGVDKTHPFLAGKVVSEACYSRGYCPGRLSSSTAPGSGVPCANKKECQHGTHVAGIAAGRDPGAGGPGFNGIAKDATIISIMVFSKAGREVGAYDSDILAAGQRVYDLRNDFHIAAANLSLGGGRAYGTCDAADPAYKAMIDLLDSAGIATVVSSGNDGWTDSLESPACISSAISVGSVSDASWGTCWGDGTAADRVTCYSNSASFLSLLAPGSLITSSVPGGKYESWHGTSMAAPHVTGAWAVLKQAAPLASVDNVETALADSGKPVADYRYPFTVKPRIAIDAALGQFRTLQVQRATSLGTVDVSANGATVTCRDPICSLRVAPGTRLTLTAHPAPGVTFQSWSDPLCGSSGPGCTITMPGTDSIVTPVFSGAVSQIHYQRTGTGSGTVTIGTTTGDYDCSTNCDKPAALTTTVTAIPSPADGSRFAGWSGACSGSGSCGFLASASDHSLTASFVPGYLLSYQKAGTGTGSVTFSAADASVSCSGTCTQAYDPGLTVTLTAKAAKGARFKGWSGSCSGKKACTLVMSQARSVTATFSGK